MNRLARLNNWYRKNKIHLFSNNKPIGEKPSRIQPVLFLGSGEIVFGKGVRIGWYPSPLFFSGYAHIEARSSNSRIVFGNHVTANNNLIIISESSVEIGDHTLIGANVEILDADFHGLSPTERHSPNFERAPIHIGENVFIGNNVKILKGVSIGTNSVVGNGAILTKSFGDNLIIGGVPAKVIGTL